MLSGRVADEIRKVFNETWGSRGAGGGGGGGRFIRQEGGGRSLECDSASHQRVTEVRGMARGGGEGERGGAGGCGGDMGNVVIPCYLKSAVSVNERKALVVDMELCVRG